MLGRVRELNLLAKFIAIVPPALMDLEWPLREFGVECIAPDTIRGEELALLCLRKLGIEVRPTTQRPARTEPSLVLSPSLISDRSPNPLVRTSSRPDQGVRTT